MTNDLTIMFDDGPKWVIGFMSGTSLDGVDVALLKTDGVKVEDFGPWHTVPYTQNQRDIIARATDDARRWNWQGVHPASFVQATQVMTQAHADATMSLLENWHEGSPVLAGFHGQTVLHNRPKEGKCGNTLQLADGQLLADALGIPVVYDFRTQDMIAGGEGAPLAPVYHKALLEKDFPELVGVVLNIGGVANFTFRDRDGTIIACDTGPGNGPIDEWVEGHGRGTFDKDAKFAKAGKIDELRMNDWLDDPYFHLPAPKSLDRYDFSAEKLVSDMTLEDGAATLTAFSASTILFELSKMPICPDIVIATGGGRLNPLIMQYLRDNLGDKLIDADALNWRGDAIEAEAFAHLAARSVRGLPISFPGTTGVEKPITGGSVVFSKR